MKIDQIKPLYQLIGLMSLGLLVACSSGIDQTSETPSSSKFQEVNVQEFNGQQVATNIDWTSLPTEELHLADQDITLTEPGTYILSGTTTKGVKVSSEGDVRLLLKGAKISSSDSAAIYVEKAANTVIELQEGSENTVKDGSEHTDSDIEGAIHSESNLLVTGSGQLTVDGNFQDGIVSTDHLALLSGNLVVTAEDDGLRGKDSLVINGGNLDVTAGGDGIKATNSEDSDKGYTYIEDGVIRVKATDDAIKAETSLVIDGGEIEVAESTEALEGTNVTINGGRLDLYANDDGINAASGLEGAAIFVKITDGEIDLEVASGDTDAIDSNGDIIMSGGKLDITARFAFDFDNLSDYTGGTIRVNGQERTEITSDSPGGGGRPRD